MLNKPACTLLHLGCGLGNGLANLHNAHKAKVPVLNIVGDHATSHVKYNAQLQSDIETIARNFSGWVKTTKTPEELCDDAQDAIKSSHKREVATLILPADVSWTDGVDAKEPAQDQFNPEIDETRIQQLVQVLKSSNKVAMILGGAALQEPMLNLLSKISEVTGVQLFAEVFPTKMQRGVGRPYIERMAYFSELASVQLTNFEHIILVDSRRPVSFFAYPDKSSDLVPEGCEVHQLVDDYRNLQATLEHVCEQLNAMHIAPNLQEKATQLLQFQTKQLEPRLESGSKMFPRFLLTLNILDEFGYRPGLDEEGYYSGNPEYAHYPLFEDVLNDFELSQSERNEYKPSLISHKVRAYLENSFNDYKAIAALLAVAEEEVILFSPALRHATHAVGFDVDSGYYFVHGVSDDTTAEAADDDHEDDLWLILAQACTENDYDYIRKICFEYCNLWQQFWDKQIDNLQYEPYKKLA